jgi:hypothetical protein
VTHDPYEIKNGKIEFHNIKTKIEAREKMLSGQWPGRGCEHCKSTEDSKGNSDRLSSLNMPGVTAPKELETNRKATRVTPTQLEIYFSNTCNLKCIYCNSKFSSTIDNENRIHGEYLWGDINNRDEHLYLPGKIEINPKIQEDTDKLFLWLDQHIQDLNKLMILGGEPFLQKETERLVEFLEGTSNKNLTLVVFSNLTVDTARVQKWLARMWSLVEKGQLYNIQVVGSLDCWGDQAEYVRKGLDLKKYVENFEFILNRTRITPSINSAMTALTIPTLPDLIRKVNEWSTIREVYWSGMKAGDTGRKYLNPTIFGKHIIPLGMDEAIQVYETNGDPIKESQLNNLKGIRQEANVTEPDQIQQKLLKVYLKELDRRRGTDYRTLFPTIDLLFDS